MYFLCGFLYCGSIEHRESMAKKDSKATLPNLTILAAVAYLVMVSVNILANALPINGMTSGEVSDVYPNLFAPAGIAFSIWGLIYLLLGAYTIYQLFAAKTGTLVAKIAPHFIVSSLANSAWIFAWHYRAIGLTVVLMLVLLASLISIAEMLRATKLSGRDRRFIGIPFGVYFGWITVATIANVTVFLVSIGWSGLGLPDSFWTVVILLVGASIGSWRIVRDRNAAYGLVLVWAYAGIWFKHTSAEAFNNAYPQIVWTVLVCLAAFVVTTLYIVVAKKSH